MQKQRLVYLWMHVLVVRELPWRVFEKRAFFIQYDHFTRCFMHNMCICWTHHILHIRSTKSFHPSSNREQQARMFPKCEKSETMGGEDRGGREWHRRQWKLCDSICVRLERGSPLGCFPFLAGEQLTALAASRWKAFMLCKLIWLETGVRVFNLPSFMAVWNAHVHNLSLRLSGQSPIYSKMESQRNGKRAHLMWRLCCASYHLSYCHYYFTASISCPIWPHLIRLLKEPFNHQLYSALLLIAISFSRLSFSISLFLLNIQKYINPHKRWHRDQIVFWPPWKCNEMKICKSVIKINTPYSFPPKCPIYHLHQ